MNLLQNLEDVTGFFDFFFFLSAVDEVSFGSFFSARGFFSVGAFSAFFGFGFFSAGFFSTVAFGAISSLERESNENCRERKRDVIEYRKEFVLY